MSSVNTTLDLYNVLMKHRIPILKVDGKAEPLFRIIDSICDAWHMVAAATWVNVSRSVFEDAIQYMYNGTSPDDWSDRSRSTYATICRLRGWDAPEWNDPDAASNELDEFLSSFHIVGGDDS